MGAPVSWFEIPATHPQRLAAFSKAAGAYAYAADPEGNVFGMLQQARPE